MREYVFKRSRLVSGKRVYARYWSSVYTLAKGDKPLSVPLHTPSERVARKMLRALIERKQMEREGILAPESMRSAASSPLAALVAEYEAD